MIAALVGCSSELQFPRQFDPWHRKDRAGTRLPFARLTGMSKERPNPAVSSDMLRAGSIYYRCDIDATLIGSLVWDVGIAQFGPHSLR
jgi:hypothetical protein